MIGSLYSGISGLKANTQAMSVIGDNIANVDTTGFKASRVSFSNVFNASLTQSDAQIGRGVRMSGTSSNWNSGTMESTNNVTDLAINGEGMFIVEDPADSSQFYTRSGQFEFDRQGFLVNPDGFRLQGNGIDPAGNYLGMGDISLPPGSNSPAATGEITMGINLDANATVDANEDYNTTMTVYDSLGNPIELTFNFTHTDAVARTWDYYVTSSAGTVTAPVVGAQNTLTFDAFGALTTAGPDTISLTLANGATTPLDIDWDLANSSVTDYAANSVKTAQTQDGYPSGQLQGVAVDEGGVLTGLYSNGSNQPFAQLVLADFANYAGLSKQGGNLYISTLESGQPIQLTPNTAGVGSIASSSLEMSNVDLSTEFVELITTQRAFQANSKVITTSDEVLAELINIKR